MKAQTLSPDPSISLFVKSILVFENTGSDTQTVLPFFADGYPGLMFQHAEGGLVVKPHDKQMPALFLYGQTLTPIELVIGGSYQLIVLQLYPFVLESLFNVPPKELNDGCYRLDQLPDNKGTDTTKLLTATGTIHAKIQILTDLIRTLVTCKKEGFDLDIATAITKIIEKKGQVVIKDIYSDLYLTERTFERRFIKAVGLRAKQFAQIIQFQQSFEQLSEKGYPKLTDIVFQNGFADQSHFIKVFKAFTGKTPSAFRAQK